MRHGTIGTNERHAQRKQRPTLYCTEYSSPPPAVFRSIHKLTCGERQQQRANALVTEVRALALTGRVASVAVYLPSQSSKDWRRRTAYPSQSSALSSSAPPPSTSRQLLIPVIGQYLTYDFCRWGGRGGGGVGAGQPVSGGDRSWNGTVASGQLLSH